ncbi:hypothetical protein V1517DRAFT_309275 [Lipomyces orientalis]|uniref:Uncharacterized protein n=1 Tax=Lipomyces orientalis TaxID=1233043 RepID=A0ACC3TJS5_9ASCO
MISKRRKGPIVLAVCVLTAVIVVTYAGPLAASVFQVGSHRTRQSVLDEPKWTGSPNGRLADSVYEGRRPTTGSPLLRHRKTSHKELLQSCSKNVYSPSGANLLINAANPEGAMSRLSYAWFDNIDVDIFRFSPSVIPYPTGSQHPYIGFAIQSLMPVDEDSAQHAVIIYCDMDWTLTDTFELPTLTCVTQPKVLNLPRWRPAKGSCDQTPVGHVNPRIFMSPLGEPLMLVATNGKANCLHEFVVDLRTFVPDLAPKFKIETVPIRFANLTALPRESSLAVVEEHYQLLFDDKNAIFVQHDIGDRSLTSMSDYGMRNLAVDAPTPECVLSLQKPVSDPDNQKVSLEQATNALRVTLCEYPCEPTLGNTVLMSIMHVKYEHLREVYYRRYLVVMNATAPFHILARSSSLIYLGSEERATVYTVAMQWDHSHFRTRSQSSIDPHNPVAKRAQIAAAAAKVSPETNSLVNDYYHGWLDDTVLISIGLNDQESAFMHINASQLLDCLEICPR